MHRCKERSQGKIREMEQTVQRTESYGLSYPSVGPKFSVTLPRKRNQKMKC